MARSPQNSFRCPHCGAAVPRGALACRECGSDAETGWLDDADAWSAELPTGYGEEEDFDYDEFVEREFTHQRGLRSQPRFKSLVVLIIVLLTCVSVLVMLLGF